MRIAIECFWLNTKEITGVGYYILNILREINELVSSNTFYLLYTGEKWIGPNLGDNFIPVCYGKGKVTLAVWFELHKVIKKLKPDLYHATFPTRVPPQKLPCPVVTTIHDLLPLHISKLFKKIEFNITTHWAWTKSAYFLCNSYYTANEIQKFKNISQDKITVTYLAPAHKIKEWNPPGKHLLFVGSLTSRKNPIFLVKVYKELCLISHNPPPLIFVGYDFGGLKTDFLKEINECPKNGKIEWLEYVKTEKLTDLYSNSILYILPSRLEGFGMPVIEAISAGVPVVCSDIDVFKEITDSSSVLINGWNEKEWAKTVYELLKDEIKLKAISEKGKVRSGDFNWKSCAEKTLEIYKQIIKTRN